MATESNKDSQSSNPGSALCLACGLCCNGVLHQKARISPQEIPFAESLGLTVQFHPEQSTFHLPCPRWQDGRCTVYPVRPNVCGVYRCKLLLALDAHDISLEGALKRVTEAKSLLSEIETMIGDSSINDKNDSIWKRVARFARAAGYQQNSPEFALAYPILRLKASSLHWLIKRHFLKEKSNPTLPAPE